MAGACLQIFHTFRERLLEGTIDSTEGWMESNEQPQRPGGGVVTST